MATWRTLIVMPTAPRSFLTLAARSPDEMPPAADPVEVRSSAVNPPPNPASASRLFARAGSCLNQSVGSYPNNPFGITPCSGAPFPFKRSWMMPS